MHNLINHVRTILRAMGSKQKSEAMRFAQRSYWLQHEERIGGKEAGRPILVGLYINTDEFKLVTMEILGLTLR